ncbi:MAG: Fe-S cluster assembly protein SufD [Crocinitomicaceae bacterium]|nr:Fe-S cluster assembly protein SufD [Crocinitomicaceae bacterium]|tara:strand:- start:1039 stop:2244 length:1206 start_codon:yes stop_codon:yes gene_type:complete
MSVFTDKFSTTLPPPTRKSERWKYSPIAKLLNHEIAISTESAQGFNSWPESLLPNPVLNLDAYLVVFKNGIFEPTLSDLPVSDGVDCVPFSKMDQSGSLEFSNGYHHKEWIGELNETYRQDGLSLHVHRNVKVDRPIVIHHLTDGINVASFPKHLIKVDEGGELNVVIWSSATDRSSGMYNGLLEASIGPNAMFSLEKVCNEGGKVFHFSHEYIVQERDSNLKMHTFTIKGDWVRNELEIISRGKGTDSVFNGAYLPLGTEHIDNHTTMDHTSSDCTSSELYRGIMYGKSTGVFNGKVFVRPDAQKTNAFQQNTNIVSDRGSAINTKPELEIYADDVKCAHGCTVGQFDLDALFYLKSRGIDEKAAKALLVEAFLADVLSSVSSTELSTEIMSLYRERHGW